MKFAPIVPMPMLESIGRHDYHMVLAPLYAEEPVYRDFYQGLNAFKILDNGAAEGRALATEELLEYAAHLAPDEVIAPDVMHDMSATVELLELFCDVANRYSINVMAVMQAKTWNEFEFILHVALTCNVTSLALPKLLTKWMGTHARKQAASRIREYTDIPIHCLGSSKYARLETEVLALQGIVRGIDTAMPVVFGLQGRDLREDATYDWEASHKAIDNYWHQTSTDLVEVNLGTFRGWCNSKTPSPS